MDRCKSCGARIMWIPTASGKVAQCDPKPIPYKETRDGKLALVTSDGRVIKAKVDAISDNVGFVLHSATCPYGDKYKQK